MTLMHGGDVWQSAEPDEYLDFSANLNPEGPPDWVRHAMARGLERARYYPDWRGRAARSGMAEHLRLPEACVLVTAGGIEAAALAAGLPGAQVIAQPTFQEYGRLCGAYRSVPRDALEQHAFAAGEALWICNPNNPTGDGLSRETMLRLLDRAEAAGARLIVDEAFIAYCPENSVADCVQNHPSLIVLGSLTKALAIPGVRLGYLAAHPTVVAGLSEALLPWRLNCVAEAVAAALPGHGDDFRRIRQLNDKRREDFAGDLRALGIRVHPSNANFLLCDFGRDMRADIQRMRDRGLLVRPCGMFPGLTHGHVRLCVRTEAENARLIECLAARGAAGRE